MRSLQAVALLLEAGGHHRLTAAEKIMLLISPGALGQFRRLCLFQQQREVPVGAEYHQAEVQRLLHS